MPTKQKPSKSDAVRALYKNGMRSATEIRDELKKQGMKVNDSQIYGVIAKLKGKRGKKRAAHGKRQSSDGTGAMNGFASLDAAVVFCRVSGGIDNARAILAKLAELN